MDNYYSGSDYRSHFKLCQTVIYLHLKKFINCTLENTYYVLTEIVQPGKGGTKFIAVWFQVPIYFPMLIQRTNKKYDFPYIQKVNG